MSKYSFFLLLALLVFLAACGAPTSPEPTSSPVTQPAPTQGRVFVLGDVSDDPGEVIEGTQPLADYLEEALKPLGVTEVQVRVAASTDEMTQLLSNGDVDLYFDSVYPAALISNASGAQIILRRWRFGVEEYHSVIFASKESGITSLEGLKGHMIALDAPYSTSGYMLPAVYMLEKGLKLTGKATYSDPVAPDEVGFAFSYDDENTLQWVLSGFTVGGVTDDYNFDQAFPKDATARLVELARTESAPRQVVLARKGLEEELLDKVKETLITMHENEAGKAALEPFQTSRFDEFPEGIEAALARMRAMMEIVKGIPLP